MDSRRPWWCYAGCSSQQTLWLGAVIVAVAFSAAAHAQIASVAGSASGLGPVELIVEKVWNLERRAIEQGQLAAGTLFGGLATIHLMVVALQAVSRGDSLAQFQEQLLWTGAFGSAIAFGPDWARSIIEFFRNVGRAVGTAPVTPQRFLDMCIELLSAAKSADLLVGFVFLLIAVLAGLLALVIFYQETESHVILGAGAVVLGFGGAAATRDIAIRYFRLALGSGLRLMVVEMLNAAVMDTLLAGAQQAKTDGLEGLETASTLLLGLLIVLGFTILLPVVVHSLASGSISSAAETLLAGLPAMAAAGGVAKIAAAALGMGGGAAAAALGGKRGGSSGAGASQEAGALHGAAGGGQDKRAGRGGAVPSKEAVLGQRSSPSGRGRSGGSAESSGGGSPELSGDSSPEQLDTAVGAESPAFEPSGAGVGQAARADASAGLGAAGRQSGGNSAQGRQSTGAQAQQPAGRETGGARSAGDGGASGGVGSPAALPASTNSEALPMSFWLSSASGWVGSAVAGASSGVGATANSAFDSSGDAGPFGSGGTARSAAGATGAAAGTTGEARSGSRPGARSAPAPGSSAGASSPASQSAGFEAAGLGGEGAGHTSRGRGAMPSASPDASGIGSANGSARPESSGDAGAAAGDAQLVAGGAAGAAPSPRVAVLRRISKAPPGGNEMNATQLIQWKGRES